MLTLPQLVSWLYFPDPPRHLYIMKKNKFESLRALQFYHGTTEHAGSENTCISRLLQHVVEPMFAAWETEELLTIKVADLSLAEILRTRHLRIPMSLCLLGFVAGAVSGNAIKCSFQFNDV